jgi:hypothetical protein
MAKSSVQASTLLAHAMEHIEQLQKAKEEVFFSSWSKDECIKFLRDRCYDVNSFMYCGEHVYVQSSAITVGERFQCHRTAYEFVLSNGSKIVIKK